MSTIALLSPKSFDEALAQARTVYSTAPGTKGLASVLDAAMIGELEAVWDSIEQALRAAFRYGKQKAEELLTAACLKADTLIQQAEKKGREIHEALIQRLQAFVQNVVRSALSLVPSTIALGETKLVVSGVSFSQKLAFGGSLKLALNEVCEIVSNGEFQVETTYALAK